VLSSFIFLIVFTDVTIHGQAKALVFELMYASPAVICAAVDAAPRAIEP
jgi:hypothetical protein